MEPLGLSSDELALPRINQAGNREARWAVIEYYSRVFPFQSVCKPWAPVGQQPRELCVGVICEYSTFMFSI